MSIKEGEYSLVYRFAGRMAHVIITSLNYNASALCGMEAAIGGWYGTGNQDEYDKAQKLPLCSKCEKNLKIYNIRG